VRPVTPAIYWLPALGVGVRPNERFAAALRAVGIEVVIHEWRGLGASPIRASRGVDWGYRELLEADIPEGLQRARSSHPGRRWWIGGHSLGGQLGLLHAARSPETVAGSVLVASGQPHWRAFPGPRALGVLAFMGCMPLICAAVGHYPGHRLGFAGREAARLMRDWAHTGRTGGYRLSSLGWDAEAALREYKGPVRLIALAQDRLVPTGAISRLRDKTPSSDWRQVELDATDFCEQKADHFGWLKEPAPVVGALETLLDHARS